MGYSRIGRPAEAHGVTSPEAYRAAQRAALSEGRRRYPARSWPDPFEASETPAPFVSGGRWVVECQCGNAPSYDPAWRLACCFECGAVLSVTPPDGWREIETVLMARASATSRHYLPAGVWSGWESGDTLATLIAENAARGVK